MTDSSSDYSVKTLVVIGIGLIGGSLAAAARQRNLCKKVVGIAQTDSVCARAVELGIVDEAYTCLSDIAAKLGAGDVIFIAVPTLSIATVLNDIRDCVSQAVTITDGASVKGSVVEDIKTIYGFTPQQFVPGHPIAGSEKSGVEAANPDLYEKHRIILTPLPETGALHLERVKQMWEQVGAEVLSLGVYDHDEILAATSHLPHAIAYSLVDTLAHDSQNENIFRYAAGGFRDFTRIASSDATMWRDIMLANDQAVVKAIDLFASNLQRMKAAIQAKDGKELMGIFTRAKAARDHFSKMLNKSAYLDFNLHERKSFEVQPGACLKGEFTLPGDKSITHRALILGAIAEGTTEIHGGLKSEDVLATIQAFRDMNVVIEENDQCIKVYGVGKAGLEAPVGPIYLGNSGTSMRLLTGLLAAQKFDSVLIGDKSLSRRPMERVAIPLNQMGAFVSTSPNGSAPISIGAARQLQSVEYKVPMASAHVKSAILLAALYCEGTTTIIEPGKTRDHTERMLNSFGCKVEKDGQTIRLNNQVSSALKAASIQVPGDISSAAFFIVAATINPGSEIILKQVGVNPSRCGVINILRLMGANISLQNTTHFGAEPVADIHVKYAALTGVDIPLEQVSLAIDEFPAIFVAAACAQGKTHLSGAGELRVKETDRLQAMAQGLRALGVDCSPKDDGMVIRGGEIEGGCVDSCGDHRTAMAFAVLGTRAKAPVTVKNCAKVATSFPNFSQLAKQAGISIEIFDS